MSNLFRDYGAFFAFGLNAFSAAFSFGVWQKNFSAGIFLFSGLFALSFIPKLWEWE